jgi:hypothetical protein
MSIIENNDFYYFNFENKFIPLIKTLFKQYTFNGELCNIHHILSYFPDNEVQDLLKIKIIGNDRNNVFLSDYYRFVDTNPIFINYYKEFIIQYIKPLFKNETQILYQTTPNLRISFPNSTAIGRTENDDLTSDIVGIHTDGDFGHSNNEINFTIPLTEMFDTNSIYFQQSINSNENLNDFLNLKLNTNQLFMAKFSQIKHYNRINKTNQTRLSLDFRVMTYSSYNEILQSQSQSLSSKKRMVIGEYFSLI